MTLNELQVAEADDHPARIPLPMLLKKCSLMFLRRSGPGGQHRNKVETAVLITHKPTGLSAEANESRSQDSNRQSAVNRLRLKLAVEVRSQHPPLNLYPSELWISRLKGKCLSVSLTHENYAALLAEAMDMLSWCGWDHAVAAQTLQTTGSQLIKFLAKYPPAIHQLNESRKVTGLRVLKPS